LSELSWGAGPTARCYILSQDMFHVAILNSYKFDNRDKPKVCCPHANCGLLRWQSYPIHFIEMWILHAKLYGAGTDIEKIKIQL